MTEARISDQYDDVLSTTFDPPAMQKLATQEFIAEKVFKYISISFDYNCRKSKTSLKF